MPLIKSKSKQAMGKNIATEMHAGKPQKQAIAIAFSVRRNAKQKKALGGAVEHTSKTPIASQHAPEGFEKRYYEKAGAEYLNEGGMSEEESNETLGKRINYPGASPIPKPSPTPEHKYAHGGMAYADEHYESIVDAILAKKKHAKMMADGGEISADDDSMETPASLSPYDDDNADAVKKELYDTQQLGPQPMDSNEHGDVLEDEDEHDMVGAVRKRMKMKREP